MEGVKKDRESKQLFEDPKYNLDGIIHTLTTLKKQTDAIFNKPPPKREEPKDADANKENENDDKKADEKQADEKAEEKQAEKPVDTEMTNEEVKAEN